MFVQPSSHTVTVQAGLLSTCPPLTNIHRSANVLEVAGSILTAIDEPPEFVLLGGRKVYIVSVYGKPSLEVKGVDGGGFHHMAAHIALALSLE